jgi:methyl-accepting chemotaxis protein
MKRITMMAALGLVLALGVLASACAPEEEQMPLGAPPAERAPEVEGARATPAELDAPQAEELLREIDDFQVQLTQLEAGDPEAADLTQMAARASELMGQIEDQFGTMDPSAGERVLREMSEVSRLMAQVTHSYAEGAEIDPQAGQSPLPDYRAPTPEETVTPIVGARQTIAEIREMRADIRQMAAGEPAPEEITRIFGRMSALFQTMADQMGTELAAEVETMVGEMSEAMEEMEQVVQAQEIGSG